MSQTTSAPTPANVAHARDRAVACLAVACGLRGAAEPEDGGPPCLIDVRYELERAREDVLAAWPALSVAGQDGATAHAGAVLHLAEVRRALDLGARAALKEGKGWEEAALAGLECVRQHVPALTREEKITFRGHIEDEYREQLRHSQLLVAMSRQAVDAAPPAPAGQAEAASGPADQAEPGGGGEGEGAEAPPGQTKKTMRSTARGDGRAKIVAMLTAHHEYADGSCLNTRPIGINELARMVEVSPSTAHAFFNKEFGGPEGERGHAKYLATCRDAGRLADALRALNDEFSPHHLYGRCPPGEGDRDEDE